jgi:peptide deformylase
MSMSKLIVRLCGDPVLRKKARPVRTPIPRSVQTLVDDMFETMEEEAGVGLAAPQIGRAVRLFVAEIPKDGPKIALINPRITARSKELAPYSEGCLSVPGLEAEILRPKEVTVRGLTPEGKQVEITDSGLLARVMQHEIDHLDGVLFIDYLTEEERRRIEPALKEIAREAKRRVKTAAVG